ncbi:hypothetical protein SXCC_03140 [Gluconacetobacter sp. SXCC-1]|nr:hypothetical protein SXCC_03140 [Gluconacetobacter sp. SXCC-1]
MRGDDGTRRVQHTVLHALVPFCCGTRERSTDHLARITIPHANPDRSRPI